MTGLVIPSHVAEKMAAATGPGTAGTCGSCRHCKKDSDGGFVCARFPPQVTILVMQQAPPRVGIGPQPLACYPPIRRETISCGEHKAPVLT